MTNLKQIITYWDKAETKIKKVYFVDEQGLKHGASKLYDENGVLYAERNYKDDELHGVCREYYSHTTFIKEEYYENGVEVKVKIK